MSEIKKLRIKANSASTKNVTKFMIATKDALALTAEIQDLDEQRIEAIKKSKALREQLEKTTKRLLQAENETPKILNITGGKFK